MARSVRSSIATAALAMMTLGVTGLAAAHDIAWYDASMGTLPQEQCWEFVNVGSAAAPVMVDGGAQLGPTLFEGKSYWRRELLPFRFADGAAITIDATVFTSTYLQTSSIRRCGFSIFMVDDDGRWARLGVSNSRLVLQTTPNSVGDKVKAFETGDMPHVYRVEFLGSTVRVSVDGEVLIEGTSGMFADDRNAVTIGDSTGFGHSNTVTNLVIVESVPQCGGPDFDCDGDVDANDLAYILSNWGDPACSSDLDGDGLTNEGDLSVLLGAWTT